MKLKRAFALLLSAMLVCFAVPKQALAEEVRVSVTANPTALGQAGEVTLTFAIANYSDYELNDVRISSQGIEYLLSVEHLTVPPNGTAENIQIVVAVNDSQIGMDMLFTVSWSQGGEQRSQDVVVNIPRAAEPVITLTRTADKTQAREGDIVRIEYKLSNETVFDMSNITLTDSAVSDQPIQTGISLRRGDTSTLSYSYTMSVQDVVSAPIVTYTVNGKSKTFSAVEPLTIQLLVVKLSLAVSMGAPTAAGVQFSLEVSNSGNQEIKDITILDDKKNFVNSQPFSLAPGESVTYPHSVVPLMTEAVRAVAFTISGTDASGQAYTLEPIRTYEVYPYVDESQIQTSIRAETVEEWSAETGSITVRLTITNTGTVSLSNVQISETTLGIVDIIDQLGNGDTQQEYKLSLGSPRNLAFNIKGQDPTGATRDLGSCQLAVAYSDASAVPEATPVPLSGSVGIFGGITNAISRILIILGIMMAVAFCFLLVLTVMERNSRRRYHYYGDADADEEEEKSSVIPDEAFGKASGAYVRSASPPYARPGASGNTARRNLGSDPSVQPQAFYQNTAEYNPVIREVEAIYDRPVEVEYDDEGKPEPMPAPAAPPLARIKMEEQEWNGPRVLYAHPEPEVVPKRKKTVIYIHGEHNDERF